MEEDKKQIMVEGLQALRHLQELNHAVSTKKRFEKFAEQNELETITEDEEVKGLSECILHDGKVFELHSVFKQKGYGAWHIGSAIEEIKRQDKKPLIINLRRNRRKLFRSIN